MVTRRLATAALFAALLFSSEALALELGDCNGFEDLSDKAQIALARVAEARAPFVKNASAAKGCPSESENCRDRAFLVKGDLVVLSGPRAAFACVDYLGKTGLVRAGWMKTSDLALASPSRISRDDWLGEWTRRPEAKATIAKGASPDAILVSGEATFGLLDPERVKRGAVNSGEISAALEPRGAFLAFAMGDDDKTLPFVAGGDFACRVQMRRVGAWLLIADNRACGGMNVSFTGFYQRKQK